MGYGGWREERYVSASADEVFDHLLGVLMHLGYEIQRADPTIRGVTAIKTYMWSWWASGAGRVAARVDPAGDRRSCITIESAPAYLPAMFGERAHRKNVERIVKALGEPLGV